MRRYMGRATGHHRKPKNRLPLLAAGVVLASAGIVLMFVLIMNPGADRSPGEERGSASKSVTPTGSTHPTPSGL